MNAFKKSKIFLVGLSLLTMISCNSNNNNNTPVSENSTELLTGYSKIEIGDSTIQCDGITRLVAEFDTENINGVLYLILALNEDEFVAISTSGQAIDGNNLIAQLNNHNYQGHNFTIEEVNDNITRATGVLNSTTAADKTIIIEFDETSFGKGNSTIDVDGNIATINGELGSITYNQILDLNQNERQVNILLLQEIDGSVNDEVNVETGRLIRQAGYTTWVNSSSEIFSGGVDLFCSGKERVIDNGAVLGVHSWCCGENGEEAFEIPENDPQHTIQIEYFNEMLGQPIGREFYFYTINAAGADDIHEMTAAEIEQYGLATE